MSQLNRYYLDEAGLSALIAKIKNADLETQQLLAAALQQVAGITICDQYGNLNLDQNGDLIMPLVDPSQPYDATNNPRVQSLQIQINNLKTAINTISGNSETRLTDLIDRVSAAEDAAEDAADAAADAQDTADAAFNRVSCSQDNSAQTITINFFTPDTLATQQAAQAEAEAGVTVAEVPAGVVTIDTTDFIVHGMLDGVTLETVTPASIASGGAHEDADQAVKTAVTTANGPLKYLKMTFAVAPAGNDNSTTHTSEGSKVIWVAVNDLFNTYTATGDTYVSASVSGTQITVGATSALTTAVSNANTAYSDLHTADTGVLARLDDLEDAADDWTAMQQTAVNNLWDGHTVDYVEPTPESEPEEPEP